MKQTFIFEPDEHITGDDLYCLVRVADRSHVSWRGEMTGRNYTRVQVFATPQHMHDIAIMAGFSGEQLRHAIPAARQRGDKAVQKASDRLSALREKASSKTLEEARVYWQSRVEDARKELHEAEETLLKPFRERLEFVEGRLEYIHRQITPVSMPGGTKRSKRSA